VFTAATFAATTVGDIVVAGDATFGAAAVPGGNVTVSGTLSIGTSGSLTVAAGKTLANAGTVALTGTGSVVLATAGATTGGAKLTGVGKLTAQDLEIVGGDGWTANLTTGNTAAQVTIASTATAGQSSITGGTSTALIGGTDATITQKAGTASNSLTLTTVTVDVSTAGSLVLKGAASNGAKVSLTASTAIIKGGETSGAALTGTLASLGGSATATVDTLNTNTIIKAKNSLIESITGGTAAGVITAVGTTDVVLDKDATATVGT
jgi:hypothetical protein